MSISLKQISQQHEESVKQVEINKLANIKDKIVESASKGYRKYNIRYSEYNLNPKYNEVYEKYLLSIFSDITIECIFELRREPTGKHTLSGYHITTLKKRYKYIELRW